jgi:peptidylprolyl isomerase
MRRLGLAALFAAVFALFSAHAQAAADPQNTLLMQLKDGTVVIELRPDLAPRTVAHFKELVRRKFYDGLTFHRVIDGFMAQTGDPKGDGSGGSGITVPPEFGAPFVRGTLGLARSESPNSGDSQFFICFAPKSSLDNKYTIFGNVVSGMEFVDAIKKGEKSMDGKVFAPDKIITLRIAADVKP